MTIQHNIINLLLLRAITSITAIIHKLLKRETKNIVRVVFFTVKVDGITAAAAAAAVVEVGRARVLLTKR